jgi:hypothetical protein
MRREEAAENNPDATIEKVSNVNDFYKYEVMPTPARMPNGRPLPRENYQPDTLFSTGYRKTIREN